MLTFNGQNLLCIQRLKSAGAPEVFSQDNHFAGVWGTSSIFLGTGGREITFDVWLTDSSFSSASAVDNYRAALDLAVGSVGQLSTDAGQTFGDCRFEGFEAADCILPAIGVGLPAGGYYQRGMLKFKQLTVP